MNTAPDHEQIAGELNRITASRGFVRNERMSRFLRFIVERSLAGRDVELKESVIATEVFGRKPDYDPKVDSIVRTEAARLRARLTEYYAGDGRSSPLVIEVPKGAYVPLFRQATQTTGVPGQAEGARTRTWRRVSIAAAVLLVAIASAGAWALQRRAPAPITIAVLPFENLSPKATNDYFVDGLTDEIIRNLSVIDGLAVRSRTSSFLWKGRPRSIREAGEQLGANYLLEGSVLRDGEQLRINAQLVRAGDDVSLWSGQFDRNATDVFSIQDEISLGIVNNLRLQLGRGRRRYETSVDAYDLFLHADMLATPSTTFSERDSVPPMTPNEARAHTIETFQAAIAKDPSFAPAYAGLATMYALRSVQFPEAHPPDELTLMRAAADRALQLDPLLPDAHHAMAMVNARVGRWSEAEKNFRRAIELDPNAAGIRSDYAYWLLEVLSRHDDAIAELRAAERADPLSEDVRFTTALILVAAGRYDEAEGYCQRLAANGQCLARVRAGQERYRDVVQLLTDHPSVARNPQTRGYLGFADARADRRAEAEGLLETATYPNERALIFAGLGDTMRAIDALEGVAALGPQRLGLYLNYPELRSLRADVRVQAIKHKAGLP